MCFFIFSALTVSEDNLRCNCVVV